MFRFKKNNVRCSIIDDFDCLGRVCMPTSLEVGTEKKIPCIFFSPGYKKLCFLYLHPQHSFLHNFLEGAGQVAEEVAPELLHMLL